MSPIGDGEIQAYLDGAYEMLSAEQLVELERRLAEDEAFAARVEEARGTRERALEILRESGPTDIALPPFEELQRRAATRPPGEVDEGWRRVGMPPIVGLGWAATVVLALGVGWFVGQGAGAPTRFTDAAQAPEANALRADQEPDADATFAEEVPAGEAVGFAFETKKKEDSGELEKRRDFASRPEEAPAAAAPERSAAGSIDAVAVTGEAESFRARQNEANEDPIPTDLVASRIPDRQKAASPPAVNAAEAGLQARLEQDRVARGIVGRDDSKLSDVTPGSGAYVGGNREALMRSAEEHVLHSLALPGLEVLGVSLEDAGALSGLKIVHRLPTGDTLEIRYVGLFFETADPRGIGLDERVETEAFPALSAQLQQAALPPGWRQVVIRKENRWVVARGPISEAELRAYLMTLN